MKSIQLTPNQQREYDHSMLFVRVSERFVKNHPNNPGMVTIARYFEKYIDETIPKFLDTYIEHPNPDENYDRDLGMLDRFLAFDRFSELRAFNEAKVKSLNIIYMDTEDLSKLTDNGEKMEDKVERMSLAEIEAGLYRQFSSYLNPVESLIFENMKKGLSKPKMLAELVEANINTTIDSVIYMVKDLDFRFTCHAAISYNRLYDDDIVLRVINKKHSKLVKKVFNVDKLEQLPEDKELAAIAIGKHSKKIVKKVIKKATSDTVKEEDVILAAISYDREVKRASSNDSFLFSSRLDFNGKKHSNPVVYINKAGYAYDHVTKKNKNLIYNS